MEKYFGTKNREMKHSMADVFRNSLQLTTRRQINKKGVAKRNVCNTLFLIIIGPKRRCCAARISFLRA
ncbi:hypothetical protein, partial [Porphyromonas loveana]